jgi:hypothetical protein
LIVIIYNHVYRAGLKVSVFNIFLKDGNKAAEKVAELAVKNKTVLKQVLEGVASEYKRVKNASAKCLREISRIKPEKLYPSFDFFVDLIDGDDTILKWNAIEVLSNLTEVETENLLGRGRQVSLTGRYLISISPFSLMKVWLPPRTQYPL